MSLVTYSRVLPVQIASPSDMSDLSPGLMLRGKDGVLRPPVAGARGDDHRTWVDPVGVNRSTLVKPGLLFVRLATMLVLNERGGNQTCLTGQSNTPRLSARGVSDSNRFL
jgi:hypothetical protein